MIEENKQNDHVNNGFWWKIFTWLNDLIKVVVVEADENSDAMQKKEVRARLMSVYSRSPQITQCRSLRWLCQIIFLIHCFCKSLIESTGAAILERPIISIDNERARWHDAKIKDRWFTRQSSKATINWLHIYCQQLMLQLSVRVALFYSHECHHYYHHQHHLHTAL